jgi:hypothetical protein
VSGVYWFCCASALKRARFGDERFDRGVYLVAHLAELGQFLFFIPFKSSRVIELPMQAVLYPRPNTRAFLLSIRAHRNQVSEELLAQVLAQALGILSFQADAPTSSITLTVSEFIPFGSVPALNALNMSDA